MLLRNLGIILASLLFIRCDDSAPANYYSYLQIVKEQPQVTAVDERKLTIHFGTTENIKLTDTSKTENIKTQISFHGLIQAFPQDLHFELYANDQRIALPDTIHYSITTVVDNSLKYLKSEETSLRVKEILDSARKKNNVPDSISYFKISGIMQNIPLNNTHNPSLLTLRLKAISKGNTFYDKEQVYELKRPTLYKTRSRPFG